MNNLWTIVHVLGIDRLILWSGLFDLGISKNVWWMEELPLLVGLDSCKINDKSE
jgi:hypothetical protein